MHDWGLTSYSFLAICLNGEDHLYSFNLDNIYVCLNKKGINKIYIIF